MLTFTVNKVVAVGEAMIEIAVVGDDTYRRSFAGDNNALGRSGQVGDDDADAGARFPWMPFHLGDNAALPVP